MGKTFKKRRKMPRIHKKDDKCPVETREIDFYTMKAENFYKWLEWQNRWARRNKQ